MTNGRPKPSHRRRRNPRPPSRRPRKLPENACLELELSEIGLDRLLSPGSLSLWRRRLRAAHFSDQRYPQLRLRWLCRRRALFSLDFLLVIQDASAVIPYLWRCGQPHLLNWVTRTAGPKRRCREASLRARAGGLDQTRIKRDSNRITRFVKGQTFGNLLQGSTPFRQRGMKSVVPGAPSTCRRRVTLLISPVSEMRDGLSGDRRQA